MNIVSYVIIALAAVGLFGIGAWHIWKEKSNAFTALSFAFLLAVLLVASQFKHIKGFGFEAEMWDQKQVEAAVLIDKLKTVSESTSQQTGLLASRLGMLDSAFTNPEMAALLDQTERVLDTIESDSNKKSDLLAPIINRIKINYVDVAKKYCGKTLWRAIGLTQNDLESALRNANTLNQTNRANELEERSKKLSEVRGEIEQEPIDEVLKNGNLSQFIDAIKSAPSFDDQNDVIKNLSQLDEDLRFFILNKKLHRNIDINYLIQ